MSEPTDRASKEEEKLDGVLELIALLQGVEDAAQLVANAVHKELIVGLEIGDDTYRKAIKPEGTPDAD
jgi:hypothetical protein